MFFILFVIEIYSYQAVKTLANNSKITSIYLVVSAIIFAFLLYSFLSFDRKVGQTIFTMYTLALLMLVYFPKMVLCLGLFFEDIFRVVIGLLGYFDTDMGTPFLASRRKFVSQIGLGLAAIPFFSLIYGITIGKYNYKVIKLNLFFDDLPESFDGFKITQISDIHSGSFDNPQKISHAIDLINEQDSDMILFTGDIVNTHATEMLPWIETFNHIKKHPYGKFSVLGNHDYGEYIDWDTKAEKQANFEAIKALYGKIGFDLLLNNNRIIEKEGQKIALIGVENWGEGFKKAGDLNLALKDTNPNDFKILMSHDPSHWEKEVKNHPANIQLTLSGHTHGMQLGIEIPGYFKWSLAQYIYKQWAGLYEHLGRYVYVNRGFGFHAYPGRVGIMPEITVIQLKKR
jgi:uncharacterized protein